MVLTVRSHLVRMILTSEEICIKPKVTTGAKARSNVGGFTRR
jgi:hypothetical protein